MDENIAQAISVLPFWLAVAIIVLGLMPTVAIAARAPQVKPKLMLRIGAGLGFLASAYASLNAASPLLIG
ncbi:hypothetical protein [Pseudomonas saponiphila]|uniref:hypothetical protein n=1 Tax=Pseudomonas saponiphila TaxID=556534 RepID=UPI00115FF2EA|nr:hypothetical protein [Pseudomonas saponiphila]